MPDSSIFFNRNRHWDAALDREGVVTRDISYFTRGRNEIRLGLDPQHGPMRTASNYWPLEDFADESRAEEYIEGDYGVYWNEPSVVDGAVGSRGRDFNGIDQAVALAGHGDFDHDGGEFTLLCVFRTPVDRDMDVVFANMRPFTAEGGILIEAKDNERMSVQYRANSAWHGFSSFHAGLVTTGEAHTLLVSLRDLGDRWRLDCWVDGDRQSEYLDTGRPSLDSDDNWGSIGGLWWADARWFEGLLDEVVYFDHGVGADTARTLLSSFEEGYLVTDWREDDARAEQIELATQVPTGTDLTVSVQQDTTGQGTVDNEQEIDALGGINTYDLTGFQGIRGGRYRLHIELETDDILTTPVFHDAELRLNLAGTAIWNTSADGVLDTGDDGVVRTVSQ